MLRHAPPCLNSIARQDVNENMPDGNWRFVLDSNEESDPCENYRRRPGFHRWRHASARRADRGSDQGLQVRRLGDALFDREFGEELDRVFKAKFDLLLGRKTYEIFAGYWPYYEEDATHGGIAKLFKDIRTTSFRLGEVDTSWAGSVLLRDIADVKRLKQEDGPNLVTQGSTELVHALLANDLSRRYQPLHGAGRAWWRQKAVRRRLDAAFVQAD